MINLTKEQIKEVLDRYQDYCYWMYFGKGKNTLTEQKIKLENHEFYLRVNPNGLIEIVLETGQICIYQPLVLTKPCADSLDNVSFKISITNPNDFNCEDLEYFERVGLFVCSYFQRAIASIFWVRMQEETKNMLINVIYTCNEAETVKNS